MQPAEPRLPNRNQFLEEAKTHLDTIERGLLNLSGIVKQPETLKDLHRGAELINQGATAHNMETIQQVAQFFEDCFGLMRTASVVSDKKLEDILGRIFDTFKGLVEMQAMSDEPMEYTEQVEKEVWKELRPTLSEAERHLKSRILHEETTISEITPDSDFFHEQVNAEIEAMETIIKGENPSHYRAQLKEHCHILEQIGLQAKLLPWVHLLKTAKSAIAATENSVKMAAECAIADIREAQRLTREGQAHAIKPSQPLKAMSMQLSSPWDTQNSNDDEPITLNPPRVKTKENIQESPKKNAEAPKASDSLEIDLWGDESKKSSTKVDQRSSAGKGSSPELNSGAREPRSAVSRRSTDDPVQKSPELWEEENIFDKDSDWWDDQDISLDEEAAKETSEGFFEDLFGDETDHSSDREAVEQTQNQEEEIEDLDVILGFDDTEDELESEGESTSSESPEWELEEEVESTQENFPSSEGTLEPLEDLDSIFPPEEEGTFPDYPDQQYDPPVVGSGSPQADVISTQSGIEYYENIDRLEELIKASPQNQVQAIDTAALEALIERPSVDLIEQRRLEEPGQGQVSSPAPQTFAPPRVEQTVKVPVRLMDNLNNLIGELVVNRNSLEQDQERLRQFLDNLLEQVQNLNELGIRMQDLYERSLLEDSLLVSKHYSSSRQMYTRGGETATSSYTQEYNPLEMDRFSGFHLLSQEMIELIVRVRESSSDIEFLVDQIEQEARVFRQVTTQLQEGFTSARMVPFSQAADRLPRAVREISLKLNKRAKLQVEGKDTLVDKMILEQLYDPMTHLVNNAITHGIESPEKRKELGKAETGVIKVEAHHQGNQTIISISDDGAGLDPERIRKKAVEQRLISQGEADTLTDIDIFDFIFHPGFSTRDKADGYSGRGVGMDVVRTSLSKLRGSITIDSSPSKGATFTIVLPLTLSITTALRCKLNQSDIAFPVDGVEEQFQTTKDKIIVNQNGERWIRSQKNSTLIPFKHLSELLSYNRTLTRSNVFAAREETDEVSVVVLRSTGNVIAIQVDQVLVGQQEIVIKQLSGPVPKPVGIAGVTVTSDGSVMAIADVLELIDLFYGRVRKDVIESIEARKREGEHQELKNAEPMVLIVDDSITVRELLSMTFSKAGYRVEQARDGKEAWEKLRAGLACDMMFCDIEMPRMDGLELLSRLKEEERFADLPVGMLTSRGAERHRQMASRLGARGYFTKPYLEEVLLDAARRMLNGENMINPKVTSGVSPQ